MNPRAAVIVSLLVCASCASPPPPPPPTESAAPAPSPAEVPINPTESVPLQVVVTGHTTSGRVMLLRAKIVNPHTEPVTGVRVQLVLLAAAGDEAMKIQEIQQKELGATLQPGGSTMLRWDVESIYLESAGRFIIAAYPKRLGDKDMPPPDNWEE